MLKIVLEVSGTHVFKFNVLAELFLDVCFGQLWATDQERRLSSFTTRVQTTRQTTPKPLRLQLTPMKDIEVRDKK